MASIAINGLGRIGRAALKILEQAAGAEVVAVNDLLPPENLAYLLPASTGAALATTKALPALAGKFDAVAIRVPIPVGSIADVIAVTARPVTREEVNDAFREEAAGGRYRGILGVADHPVVSADIVGDPRASVVDAAMTQVVDQTLVKIISWYDNEWGFTCQMIREAFSVLGLPAPDLSQIRP